MWFTIKTVKPTGGNVIVILGYINEIDLIDLMRPELESIYLLKEELKKKKKKKFKKKHWRLSSVENMFFNVCLLLLGNMRRNKEASCNFISSFTAAITCLIALKQTKRWGAATVMVHSLNICSTGHAATWFSNSKANHTIASTESEPMSHLQMMMTNRMTVCHSH